VRVRLVAEPKREAKREEGAAEALQLKLRKSPLFFVLLTLPLLVALAGFVKLQAGLPKWPGALVEAPVRGALLAADGTVLAEGSAEGRRYPQGALAAHLVGFSGREQPDGSYGLEGLENTLDPLLQSGEDVVLTIDPNLQAITQTELKRAAELHGAENGAMVMLEAGTGRVLAAASYPEFDPNEQAAVADRTVIPNRAFVQQVEPGSVMKPFVVAALMQEGRLRANEVLPVGPSIRVGNQDFNDVSSHDPFLSVKDILRVSSNVGMIKLGDRFSSEELAGWFGRFGFGRDTGLRHAYTRNGHINPPGTWVPQDHASATIGQSVSATALQLAAAYSIFANDGLYVPPQLLEREVVFEDGARAGSRRVLSPEVARKVRAMLAYTVANSSLAVANVPGVQVAGKSGSADLFDVEKGEYIDAGTLSFAGIFPADDPEVIGVVYLQKVKQKTLSTYVTAPLFRAVGSETVALWGLPEDPSYYATR